MPVCLAQALPARLQTVSSDHILIWACGPALKHMHVQLFRACERQSIQRFLQQLPAFSTCPISTPLAFFIRCQFGLNNLVVKKPSRSIAGMAEESLEERFKKAVWLIRTGPKMDSTNEQKLTFYSYFKQASSARKGVVS